MQIWVDADACPKVIKDVLFRAAERTKLVVIFVANQILQVPKSLYIKTCQVQHGFDVADMYIAEHITKNDLVITADIPLANAVIEKEGIALNPRGQRYTKDNIKQILSIRNLNEELRSSGLLSGGPAKFGPREIQAFANSLDQILSLYLRQHRKEN